MKPSGNRLTRRGFLGGAVGGAAAGLLPTTAARATDPDNARVLPLRNEMRTAKQWQAFLAAQDLVWGRTPVAWWEGPFLGNGRQATMAYQPRGVNGLRFDVQHSQVQDHRAPRDGVTIDRARLPIGSFVLQPTGQVTGVDMRLDLWNAELVGVLLTDKGALAFRVFVHAERDLMVATVTPQGDESATWTFHPDEAISPRTKTNGVPAGFQPNPDPERRTTNGIELCVQNLLQGGQHVTAWREMQSPAASGERTLVATVTHSYPDSTAEPAAVASVDRATRAPRSELQNSHRAWWHTFYPKSFISFPDARLQSFYWIQLYKAASGTRRDAPVMATSGPWLQPTGWPATWWNLNVQLESWLIHGSNHLELDSLTRSISEFRQTLIESVPAEYQPDSAGIRRSSDQYLFGGTVTLPGRPNAEVGNLTWALHNVWLTYRHTMDDDLLRDTVVPMLRRTVNFYLHFLNEGPDGRLHLPLTYSPEYGDAPDCNFDLALLRWGCQTLLESTERLHIDDPLRARWQDVLDHLVDYPTDENGLMIGAGVPFAKSHRHYSHMLSVYPLYLVNSERPEHRDLIDTSLRHWIGFEGALQGYSFTGAASISAQMGRGNDCVDFLNQLLERFVQPNTMYTETSGRSPVVETPLSGAQSLHDMLVTSWGDTIRVFPAIPDAWRDVTVHDLRTQGAFLVSAVRKGGHTQFVRVKSLAGAPCRLRPGLPGPYVVQGEHGPKDANSWRDLGDGTLEIDLAVDDEVVVFTRGMNPDFTIAPVESNEEAEPWGLPPRIITWYASLAAASNNKAVSDDTNTGVADVDGAGSSLSAQALAAAGVTPGGTVEHGGLSFTWPDAAPGQVDNVVAAAQGITTSGSGTTLGFLATGTYGASSASGTVQYSDGTTQPFVLDVPDWYGTPPDGSDTAITMAYRNRPGNVQQTHPIRIFYVGVPLHEGKTVTGVVLPYVSEAAVSGTTALHIFAMAIG